MKQTTNYGLNLMEAADLLSARPLNENAEKLDAALNAQAGEILGRLKLTTGSYTGDGRLSVTIQTPGIRPQAVLIRKFNAVGASAYSVAFERECRFADASMEGCCWLLWRGQDIPAKYYKFWATGYDSVTEEDAARYTTADTEIRFTPALGSLTWELPVEVDFDHSKLVNNVEGETYEWIAFGVAE